MLHIKVSDINDLRITRRSIDSRRRQVVVNLTVRIATGDDTSAVVKPEYKLLLPVASDAPVAIIVGAGPAGLFGALALIERGVKPIVLERGKDVDSRRLDLASLNRTGEVNPDSNYCFGEGGAGTFSDGKLYTRSKKRGDNERVLNILVEHGASPDILADSHPHIGSDRLPHIIKSIRETIIKCGGEVRFGQRMEHLVIAEDNVTAERYVAGVITADGSRFNADGVILATGHSARDTIRLLHADGVGMEAKGFAVGVRLEHPAATIDRIQYHSKEGRGKWLPAAEYNFVTQVEGRGVYSFCMCPGGVIVPAVSAGGQSVVNGMSASARAGRFSNSGMVVEIRPGDLPDYAASGVFELMDFQEDLERKYWLAADKTLKAPAQRMLDFVKGRQSVDLPATSYIPGLVSLDVSKILPTFISDRLRQGFVIFGEKASGFLTNEATVVGLESRTSSPVRIPRDKDTLVHPEIKGLYPAGEGAGYAGGIVSAAVDGIRCAMALADSIESSNLKMKDESHLNK